MKIEDRTSRLHGDEKRIGVTLVEATGLPGAEQQ